MKRRCQISGFTLIELMIAISILMMVMFAIYSSWTAILRSSQVGMKAAADVQRSRIAMKAIEDAFLTAEMFVENARYYSFLTDTTTDPNFAALSLTARLPESFPGSGLFHDQVVRRVTFSVEPGTNGHALVMRQTPYLMQETEDPYPITLAQNVSLFVLEFWDTRLNDWATEFIVTNQLPRMVRVSLGTGKRNQYSEEPTEITTRVIAIPASAITRDMQVPALPGNQNRTDQNRTNQNRLNLPPRDNRLPPLQPGKGAGFGPPRPGGRR